MKTKIVRIGNSQGVRIPKPLLEQAGLKGEVTLLLDEDEVDLKPFDVVIQRGTNHAWITKGTEVAELVGILVDAEAR